ncbi:MAG: NHLP bacteriocin export ABC transporter permease/ATPase subunit [Acidobacteriota bacterium]
MSSEADLEATQIIRLRPVATGGGFRLRAVEGGAGTIGQEFSAEKSCVIGRVDTDVVVPDPSVSRRHAKVEKTATGYLLTDLQSANGTWIGDQRIQQAPLDHLDRFRVGGTVLEFFRDDEPEGDDLDLVQTAQIPRREMLESIRLALSVRLEDEGEPIPVAGNQPFLIDNPDAMWIVEEGRLEIFTVPIQNGEAAGARTHFVSVETGQALFGMDFAGYGLGSGFLAAGKTGTKLRMLQRSRLAELAGSGKHAERIQTLVETWVTGLSKSLVRDLPPGPAAVDLTDGEAATLPFQGRARAQKGVVWVEIRGGALLFVSLSEVLPGAGAILFPVTRDTWIESSVEGLSFTPRSGAAVLDRPELWRGLDAFHQALCECEFLNKRLASVDEFNRQKFKSENLNAAREAAYKDIGAVLASGAGKGKTRAAFGEAEPVFQACRAVCEELGMDARKPAETTAERSFEDHLHAVATLSRFRTRLVALRDNWWEQDQGPILARSEETKDPVALLPTGPTAYDWVDGKTGARQPMTAELATKLQPFGWVFYRRFPDGLLTVKHVLKFGMRGLGREFITLALMGAGMGILAAMTPYFTGRLFDTAIPQAERGMLVQFCLALVIGALASIAFKLTQSIAVLRVQGKMDYSVQAAMWDRLLDLPSTFFRKYSSGDLADRAQGIDAIRHLLAGAGVSAILGAMSSIFYVVLMLTYSLPLALLGIGLTVVFVTFTTVANYLQLRYQRDQLTMKGRITGLVLQLISGVGKLRVSGAEDHGFRVWAKEFSDQRRLAFKAGQIQNTVSVFNSAYPIFSSMAIFFTLVSVQTAAAAKGIPSSISTGQFIGFSTAFALFLVAMQSLSDASLGMLKAVPIWERLKPILTTPPEIDDTKTAPGALKGEIEISHVWFRYIEDGPWILQDVSLKIEPGEFVAFVGGSGSGKSTLMRLMLGFETAEKGGIYFDGQDLATLDTRLVRQQLGVVLQDNRVLPSDIYRNIVGTSSRTIDEAWEAAEAAGFAEDIREMPMQMHTYVSEGGGGFSGGQKQRLMIARAIVNKPKILFLDEATSALDNKTQATVTQSMDKMNSTRICIAHRLSTIANADRICYLQNGVVAEVGSYDELMKKNGLFAELARRQQV